MPGCKCKLCYGLAEYMHQLTGNTHGLPPAEGHHSPVKVPLAAPAVVTVAFPRPEPAQPWEPRKSRYAA